jgi:hypothetical protein
MRQAARALWLWIPGSRFVRPGMTPCVLIVASAFGNEAPESASPNVANRKMFDAIAFAGGGNRCYWQGGFYEAIADRLDLAPKLVVGASAGAFAAVYSLLQIGPTVRELVISGCGPHLKNFDLAAWRRGEPLCPVGPMYRRLLDQVLDAAALARLNALTDLRLAVSRLPRGLSPVAGAMLGIATYQLEKKLMHPVHPRFGRALGFRSEFVAVKSLSGTQALHDALIASGGVPPFMPVTLIEGKPAFDGGLVDNVPVEPLAEIERSGGRSLVLLTRLYRNVPEIAGRAYVQPSQTLPIKQFDITNPDGIRFAYELGRADGARFAARMK